MTRTSVRSELERPADEPKRPRRRVARPGSLLHQPSLGSLPRQHAPRRVHFRPLPSPVAQLAEHSAVNRRVVGSSPTRGASDPTRRQWSGRRTLASPPRGHWRGGRTPVPVEHGRLMDTATAAQPRARAAGTCPGRGPSPRGPRQRPDGAPRARSWRWGCCSGRRASPASSSSCSRAPRGATPTSSRARALPRWWFVGISSWRQGDQRRAQMSWRSGKGRIVETGISRLPRGLSASCVSKRRGAMSRRAAVVTAAVAAASIAIPRRGATRKRARRAHRQGVRIVDRARSCSIPSRAIPHETTPCLSGARSVEAAPNRSGRTQTVAWRRS